MLPKHYLSFTFAIIVFTAADLAIAAKSCWWTLCQSPSRIRQGCHPQHLYNEVQTKSCNGGTMYQCCPLVNVGNNDDVNVRGASSDFNSIDTSAEESGICSWYGSGDVSQGSPTASGERFDRYALKAAHKTLPFGTRIRVMNSKSKETVDVVINDRGPFLARRILDLTYAAFGKVENRDKGLFHCSYTVLPY